MPRTSVHHTDVCNLCIPHLKGQLKVINQTPASFPFFLLLSKITVKKKKLQQFLNLVTKFPPLLNDCLTLVWTLQMREADLQWCEVGMSWNQRHLSPGPTQLYSSPLCLQLVPNPDNGERWLHCSLLPGPADFWKCDCWCKYFSGNCSFCNHSFGINQKWEFKRK